MPKGKDGAPVLNQGELEANLALLERHRQLLHDIFTKTQLLDREDLDKRSVVSGFRLFCTLTPVLNEEASPPFIVFAFVNNTQCEHLMGMGLARAFVLITPGKTTVLHATWTSHGKPWTSGEMSVFLDDYRELTVITYGSGVRRGEVTSTVGDYREEYTVDGYWQNSYKQEVEALEKLLAKLS